MQLRLFCSAFLLCISIMIQTDLHEPVGEWTVFEMGLYSASFVNKRKHKGSFRGRDRRGEMSVESSRDLSIM